MSGVGFASLYNNAASGLQVYSTGGNTWLNGTNLFSLGAFSTSGLLCIALDLSNNHAWVRNGAAGNWNANVSNNPATGVGGINLFGPAVPLYPAVSFAGTGGSVTANFGDTAFTGTVPSGFTSGFTAGVTSPTNALATQSALEHWLATNPNAQMTQTSLEHWATVTSTGVQALATLVALEQWAVVAAAASVQPVRVMVLA